MATQTDYEPFGEQWKAHLRRLPKQFIIEQYREALIKLKATSHAIAFGNWLLESQYIKTDGINWRKSCTDEFYTSEDLFGIYLRQLKSSA